MLGRSISSILLVALLCILHPGKAEATYYPRAHGHEPMFTFDQLWELETAFWDAFLYPQNKKQIEGNASTVFTPEVGI